MRGSTHLIVGAAAGVAATLSIPTEDTKVKIGIFTATLLGSLFPDIDNAQSKLGRKVKPLSIILNKLFGHRGFIHSPCLLLLLIFTGIFYLFVWEAWNYWPVVAGFAIGFISHIILDAITKGGIPFLYPFSKKRYNFTIIKTGGIGEAIFVGGFLLGCGAISVIAAMINELPHVEFLQMFNI